MYTKLQVGNKFPKRFFVEGPRFEFIESGPLLLINFNSPSRTEIEGVKSGKLEFALYENGSVLFFLTKIAGCGGWMDSPFNVQVYDNYNFDASQTIDEHMGLALQIILIDGKTGIIKAMRLVGLGTEFSQKLINIIANQTNRLFSLSDYNSEVNKLYAAYSSDDLAKRSFISYAVKK